MADPSRRDVLSAVSTLGVAAMLPGVLPGCASPDGPAGSAAAAATRNPDLIRDENLKPGTRDWLLTKPAIDRAVKYRCPWIEGYFSRASVRPGETITLHVSTNPESRFRSDSFRDTNSVTLNPVAYNTSSIALSRIPKSVEMSGLSSSRSTSSGNRNRGRDCQVFGDSMFAVGSLFRNPSS